MGEVRVAPPLQDYTSKSVPVKPNQQRGQDRDLPQWNCRAEIVAGACMRKGWRHVAQKIKLTGSGPQVQAHKFRAPSSGNDLGGNFEDKLKE